MLFHAPLLPGSGLEPDPNLSPPLGLPLPILRLARRGWAASPGSGAALCEFPTAAAAETLPVLPGIPLRMPARLGEARRFTLWRFSMEMYLFFTWSGITRSTKSLLWSLGTSESPSCFSNTSLNPSWVNARTVTTRQSTQSIQVNLGSILLCRGSSCLRGRDGRGISRGCSRQRCGGRLPERDGGPPHRGFIASLVPLAQQIPQVGTKQRT